MLKMFGFLTIAALVISVTAATLNLFTPQRSEGLITSKIQDIPYQVSIHFGGELHCGGVIVSEDYVLTAAACVTAGPPNQYFISAGTLIRNFNGTFHRVERIIVHENYYQINGRIPVNDIALIQVETPFILDGNRDYIPLTKQPARVGSLGKISGWGSIDIDSDPPLQLRFARAYIHDRVDCNRQYLGKLPQGQICAYSIEKTPCKYDAGGPLVVGVHLVGIISWGRNCDPTVPNVYTDVYAYRYWIARHIGSINSC